MTADGGEEDAARPHPQNRRHVLDQRYDAAARARRGVEPQKGLDSVFVDGRRRSELIRRERDEQVDRQDRRTDASGELGAALDPAAGLPVQAVDSNECPARPRDGSLGRNGRLT